MRKIKSCSECTHMKAKFPVKKGVILFKKGIAGCVKGNILDWTDKHKKIYRLYTYYITGADYRTWGAADNCLDFDGEEKG